MNEIKFCPFRVKTIAIHNQANDYRVIRAGLNRCRDNDIIITDFLYCLKEYCMFFDEQTQKCVYYNFSSNVK